MPGIYCNFAERKAKSLLPPGPGVARIANDVCTQLHLLATMLYCSLPIHLQMTLYNVLKFIMKIVLCFCARCSYPWEYEICFTRMLDFWLVFQSFLSFRSFMFPTKIWETARIPKYSRTSMARTLMARLPWLFRTSFSVPWKNPIAADLGWLRVIFLFLYWKWYVVCTH